MLAVIFKKDGKVVFNSSERKVVNLCREYKELIERVLGYDVCIAKRKSKN